MRLEDLINAAQANADHQGLPPVEQWHPEQCAVGRMQILKNGTWLHDGQPIVRSALVKLFSTILRKDADGKTWLVTPVEKILVEVEAAPFLAIAVEQVMGNAGPNLYFTTNVDAVVLADVDHRIRVTTDEEDLTPQPFVMVRGNLEAMLTRPVFYQLVEWAVEQDGQLGVQSAGEFFALGPKGVHSID